MSKTLQVRVDENLRTKAEIVLREVGLDMPSAVRLFLTKVVQTQGIPFELMATRRIEQVEVGDATQAKMDKIGALWRQKKKALKA